MDQQAHAPPPAPQPVRRGAPKGGKLPDLLVMVATPVVAAALAMALNLQMAVGFVESVVIAGLLAVGLLLGHALMKREQAIRDMRNELNRLTASMQALGRAPMPGPRPMMAGRPMPPPLRPMSPSMDAGAPMPLQTGTPPHGPGPNQRDLSGHVPPPPAGATEDPQASAAPKTVDPPSLVRVEPRQSAQSDHTADAPHRSFESELENLGAPARTSTIEGDGQARFAMPDLATHFRPGPAVPMQPREVALHAATSNATGAAAPVAGALPPLENPTRLSAIPETEHELALNRDEPVPAGHDVRDLEMMQNLVEQLASQLGAGRAKSSAESTAEVDTPVQNPIDSAVAASVDALRSTADTMRTALEPAPRTASPPLPPAPSAVPTAGAPDPRIATLAAGLEKGDFEVRLEPIVGLGDRKARHFEVAIRFLAKDGIGYDEDAQREIAVGSGILPRIDAAKLKRSASIVERLDARGTTASLFSGLVGESLADDHFLDAFEDTFGPRRELLDRLILSFRQSDVRAFADGHWQIVNAMSEVGMRFALDSVTDLDMDFEQLRKAGFHFVKLDADVYLEGLPAHGSTIPAADLCRHFSELGLGLIVKRIEDERRLAKVQGFGALFGQGAMFGGPRPVKIDVDDAAHAAA